MIEVERNKNLLNIIKFLEELEYQEIDFNSETFLIKLNKESKEKELNFKIKKIVKQQIRKTIFSVFCLIHNFETKDQFLLDIYYSKSFDEDSFKIKELKYTKDSINSLLEQLKDIIKDV